MSPLTERPPIQRLSRKFPKCGCMRSTGQLGMHKRVGVLSVHSQESGMLVRTYQGVSKNMFCEELMRFRLQPAERTLHYCLIHMRLDKS